jgi:hypothetical protein
MLLVREFIAVSLSSLGMEKSTCIKRLRARAHQGNWQPQRNPNFRELLSVLVEHMLLNGAAQIEAANRTIALSKPDQTHERLSFECPIYKECVGKVKAEYVFVCARMKYCKILKLLDVMWILTSLS